MLSRNIILLLVSIAASEAIGADIVITSPGNTVQATVFADSSHRLSYSVRFHEQEVLKPSPIGVSVDGADYGAGIETGKPSEKSVRAKFPWRGNHPEVDMKFRSVEIPITQSNGAKWTLLVQCSDQGVAYRCIVPGTGSRKVTGEAAAWEFPSNTFAWCEPNTANYEGVYERFLVAEIPAARFQRGIGMPVTLELPGGNFGAIVEADDMGYSGMTVECTGSWQLKSSFRDDPEGWPMTGEIKTPWRVLTLASDLNALVNNDLVPALCPPPDPSLFSKGIQSSWIKPGRCFWPWWAYDSAGMLWDRQTNFVNQAAELNCKYYLVDEGWENPALHWGTNEDGIWNSLNQICDYAATKKVGIWVWRGWTNRPRSHWPGLETQEKREDFFRRCAQLGVKGAKIDFMDSESHDRLAFYEACLRTAAKYKIMVDFHGANKPTGEARTWPNELTREGIRGLEQNKGGRLPVEHYVTLPFTRYLAGHGDFTPTTFEQPRLKGTTVAQQLACAVVYTSPFLCWADKAEVYEQSPVLDIIRTLPSVWDQTVVLPQSKLGELAIFARRSGKDWYIGVLNGTDARDITLNCSFLGSGNYQADYFGDVPDDPVKFDVRRNVKINSATPLTIHLNSGGGFVARIRK